jgi:ABC-type dipeptide/oligopeptide/nickel transport system permease component
VTRYVLTRVFLVIPVLFGVSLVVFLALRVLPGDPVQVMLGTEANPEEIQRLRRVLGLDRPLVVQYFEFLSRAARGDLGISVRQNAPVTQILAAALPATIELAVSALALSLLIAIPLGILAAVHQNSPLDHASMLVSLVGVSMPIFWSGILLILVFSLQLQMLPPFGRGLPLIEAAGILLSRGDAGPLVTSLRHLALPAFALGMAATGLVARVTRASMLETLRQDYARTARAKGLRERRVVVGHALRNALLPALTIVGLQFGALLGGAVITETIFAWPGIGRVVVQAINQRDFPVVQGSVLVIAVAFSMVNLAVDLAYAYVNPRIRFGGAH